MSTDRTPIDRAAEEMRERFGAPWMTHDDARAAVSAALTNDADPDWLADVIAAAIRDFHSDPTIPHFARHLADAVRGAILGTGQ
jgi:hypothetical protein